MTSCWAKSARTAFSVCCVEYNAPPSLVSSAVRANRHFFCAGQSGGIQFVSFLAFGTTMTLAGILAAALPETLGVATAETLSQPLLRGSPDDARMVSHSCRCCQRMATVIDSPVGQAYGACAAPGS